MRTIFLPASAALISATLIGSPAISTPAAAAGILQVTPPLYRDLALSAQKNRRFSSQTTTPQPVPATVGDRQIASATNQSLDQASVEARR